MLHTYSDRALKSDPAIDGFVMMRRGNTVHTNVPHLVTHHSPTGFEFGYGGSGPADLALNIVAFIVSRENLAGDEKVAAWDGTPVPAEVWRIYQDFKWEFLTRDRNHITIPYEEALMWVFMRISSDD